MACGEEREHGVQQQPARDRQPVTGAWRSVRSSCIIVGVPAIVRDYTRSSQVTHCCFLRGGLFCVLCCFVLSDQTPRSSSVTVKLLVFLLCFGVISSDGRRFCMHASAASDVKVKSSTKCPRLWFVLLLNVFKFDITKEKATTQQKKGYCTVKLRVGV